jgi:hypothetical protein
MQGQTGWFAPRLRLITCRLNPPTPAGSYDNLKSPAARLCVGRVVELGTGCVEVMQRL